MHEVKFALIDMLVFTFVNILLPLDALLLVQKPYICEYSITCGCTELLNGQLYA